MKRTLTYQLGTITTSATDDLWHLAGFESYSNSEEVHYSGRRLRLDVDPRQVLARMLAQGLRDEEAVLGIIAAIDDERSGAAQRRSDLEVAKERNAAAQAELRAAQILSATQKRSAER